MYIRLKKVSLRICRSLRLLVFDFKGCKVGVNRLFFVPGTA